MESGERPELNAQRYAVLSSPEGTLQKKDSHWNNSGKAFFVNAASPETLVHALRMRGNLNFWELRKFGSREGKNEKIKVFSFVCSAYVRCSFGSDWV